jgi:hypothetical protein
VFAPQNGQMLGGVRLFDIEALAKLADRQFPEPQLFHDADSRRVRQCSEDAGFKSPQ